MKRSTVWKAAVAASTCIWVIVACYLTNTSKQPARASAVHETIILRVDPQHPVRSERVVRILDEEGKVAKELHTDGTDTALAPVAVDISDLPRGKYRAEVTERSCLFSQGITRNGDPVR
ncbi:MAG TPA: hypothetical protein VHI13_13515 [Candidatus Kapabacteria bacterium]|nr:hypothetical protein [Candidatus Kapabacteria bacterium]